MTASENDKGNGAPAWAESIDLSPVGVRASDGTLKRIADGAESGGKYGALMRIVLRRLADAEMKLAELQADRGEPDYLIDRHGDAWRRTGEDSYALFDGSEEFDGRTRERIEAKWGPVTEARKGPEAWK